MKFEKVKTKKRFSILLIEVHVSSVSVCTGEIEARNSSFPMYSSEISCSIHLILLRFWMFVFQYSGHVFDVLVAR